TTIQDSDSRALNTKLKNQKKSNKRNYKKEPNGRKLDRRKPNRRNPNRRNPIRRIPNGRNLIKRRPNKGKSNRRATNKLETQLTNTSGENSRSASMNINEYKNKDDLVSNMETGNECISEQNVLGNTDLWPDLSKKFLSENNMDSDKVPEELQGLTEIASGGQHSYSGNVINIPQDVEGFTTQLPQCLSSLNVLVICQQTEED
ncbi:41714_t:CDS:2, partial [Gigaspora margarita]